jgi:flagellar motor protein MotB
LTVAGLADDSILQPNDTEAGRAANRRVELVNLTTRELVQRDVRDRPGS